MYKAIIIEDEYLLANVLESYLFKESKIELIEKFENPLEGLKYLHNNKIDLIFLDIQMPTLNGIDLAKMIPKDIAVIFTTAYSEYAVEGFTVNALDYLLKPVSLERFNIAISKFIDSKNTVPLNPARRDSLNTITIKSEGAIHKIHLNKLLYIESLKEYLRYCTFDRKFIVYGALSKVADQLIRHGFIRIHKSVIVNKEYISSVSGNVLYLNENISFNIGRSFKPQLMEEFKMK